MTQAPVVKTNGHQSGLVMPARVAAPPPRIGPGKDGGRATTTTAKMTRRRQVATLELRVRREQAASFNITKSRKVTFDLTPSRREVEIIGADNLRPTKRMDPLMVLLMGRRGRGKTLGMTCMADLQRRRWERHGLRFEIISNYWMEPAHRIDPQLVESLNMFPDWGRNLYICLDEIGSQLANRRSLAKVNVDFIQFLTQIRKRNNELITTTQFPQWIDMAVLYQIDFFCRMDIFNGNRSIEVYEWDWWGQFSGKDYRKQWPPQPQDVDNYFEIHGADLMWDAYKSDQIVPPAWAKNKMQILQQEHGEDFFEKYGLSEQENVWGDEVTPEAAMLMDLAPPKSIPELLERQPGGFEVTALLDIAKRLDPLVTSRGMFIAKLKELGWAVEKDGNSYVASLPE